VNTFQFELLFFKTKFLCYNYRKSGNFGHGFILAPKYEMPKLNTPKYVTLQKLIAKIDFICWILFLLNI
jgi:hypothetical protein